MLPLNSLVGKHVVQHPRKMYARTNNCGSSSFTSHSSCFVSFFLSIFIVILSSCSSANRETVDRLNDISYAYHYRNIDSTEYYARKALALATAEGNSMFNNLNDAKAEAYNNLAFVSIMRMNYDLASLQLDSAIALTDNQLEILIANVQHMRLCQRRSHNRDFYDFREHAMKALQRINEERMSLDERQSLRLSYAESEMAIVTSTYYYYVGLEQQSIDELRRIDEIAVLDTAQWMNYLYNAGAGGMFTDGSPEQIEQRELDCLYKCQSLAEEYGSPFFLANSLEALADHVDASESILLADGALSLFSYYGDVYQIAGAHRTLASCYWRLDNYEDALANLELALSDSSIYQAPDLVASIREQLSVVYSAMNDKTNSDYNRNIYLDLQEQTRQDRSLEARAAQLDHVLGQLNLLLVIAAAVMALLIVTLVVIYVIHKRQSSRSAIDDEMSEERDEAEERLALTKLNKREEERRNLEERAKVSLVNSITPLIDRMLHEVQKIDNNHADSDTLSASDKALRSERLNYIRELTDTINEQNGVLTQWIQLRQGELSLRIESFPLQSLFDIIEKGHRSFALKGIELSVEPTTSVVKADRVLTLFMINTLADNARKFTDKGGSVNVSSSETDNYVEISISDTGCGIDADSLSHIFEHKIFGGHGFGLQNCKGIIEKYRKTSQLFSVCHIGAESVVGQGSRFFFRLPKGIVHTLILFLMMALSPFVSSRAASVDSLSVALIHQASNCADSAYHSNINGNYEQTLFFADSCLRCLNKAYLRQYVASSQSQSLPTGNYYSAADTLALYANTTTFIPEITWLHKGVKLNYNILLVVRNESAVAALALHDWQLYHYNNRIYTLLFKELSADLNLEEYYRQLQKTQTDRTIAVVLIVIMVILLLSALAWQMANVMKNRAARRQAKENSLEMLNDELRRYEIEVARLHVSNQVLENCLSALKHETMYYPSRIRVLIDSDDTSALSDVVTYYRELYGILSQQAASQVESARLSLRKLDHDIFGDENLISYLFEILRKQSSSKTLSVDYQPKDELYITCVVSLPGVPPTNFSPSVSNIPFLLCRQIVREHGEATGRRACGIISESTADGSQMIITLPRAK